MTIAAKSPWLTARRPKLRAGVRLFCFPYAGGSEAIFRTWQQNLPETIEVLPIQLPGRTARIKEPPLTRLAPLVQALSQSLRPEMDLPFALFRQMGGLIAFNWPARLRRDGGPLPVHLFISAKCCPKQVDDLYTGEIPDKELVQILQRYEKGTPREVLENAELITGFYHDAPR